MVLSQAQQGELKDDVCECVFKANQLATDYIINIFEAGGALKDGKIECVPLEFRLSNGKMYQVLWYFEVPADKENFALSITVQIMHVEESNCAFDMPIADQYTSCVATIVQEVGRSSYEQYAFRMNIPKNVLLEKIQRR